ncbi:MAG: MBL fold metallo-hydrolase [Oscillospiraceae bacterium]|jgi:7,8-dihydropterin-6-yl-methyl-4-(beta-D-ribofuranosyl)aminobenzene 5'-phosphate synthase|nr:MBL fold metallo-hydrolase [Oscillospiraceae bacterium]
MRILSLIDDLTATDRLAAEHGSAIYIEYGGKKILFDTGASDKVIVNAERMLLDLGKLDAVVISHNHTGHIGGLAHLLAKFPSLTIYAKRAAANDFYKGAAFFRFRMSESAAFFKRYADNFVLFENFQEIFPGLYLMTDESADGSHRPDNRRFFEKESGKFKRDEFKHEVFMLLMRTQDEKDGCVVISPCSHLGVPECLETARLNFPHSPIRGTVAGFRLSVGGKKLTVKRDFLESNARRVADLTNYTVYACHSAGKLGYEALKPMMGDQLQYLRAGEEIIF